MQQIIGNDDEYRFLCSADLVIYGSFLEEQAFPPVLLHAISLGKLVVAPDLEIIKKYVCYCMSTCAEYSISNSFYLVEYEICLPIFKTLRY